jgi:hypothetical protein
MPINMFPIIIKYKCYNVGGVHWHDHMLTQEDVDWHNNILNFTMKCKIQEKKMTRALGKSYGWYIGIKEAIEHLKHYQGGEGAPVVFIKQHNFTNCCVDGRAILFSFPRQPLVQIVHPNENSKIQSHATVGKVVKVSTALKATCEPLSKQMNQKQQQPNHPQQEDIIEYHSNAFVFADENDTYDNKRHFPQHHKYRSKSIVQVNKGKGHK